MHCLHDSSAMAIQIFQMTQLDNPRFRGGSCDQTFTSRMTWPRQISSPQLVVAARSWTGALDVD